MIDSTFSKPVRTMCVTISSYRPLMILKIEKYIINGRITCTSSAVGSGVIGALKTKPSFPTIHSCNLRFSKVIRWWILVSIIRFDIQIYFQKTSMKRQYLIWLDLKHLCKKRLERCWEFWGWLKTSIKHSRMQIRYPIPKEWERTS